MAPYSNRIEDGRYTWQDKTLQLVNAVNPNKDVIHGFARVIDFKVNKLVADEDKAELVLYTDQIRKNSFPGYPFNINLTLRFTLTERNLDCEITAENIDSAPVPFGCGWHPYFKLGEEGIDNLYLEVPANKIILLDDKYVPLKGKDAYSNLDDHKDIDFRTSALIGKRKVNVCYTDLITDKNGITRTNLTDKNSRITLSVYQKGGVTYAFTADSVKYRTRKSIALEPVQFMTDAFNRPELLDEITVQPGKTSSFNFGVEVKEV
jgi:aldose 1-epimerase